MLGAAPTEDDVHLERLAPAKINLALHVVGQRADGYHSLQSLVAFAAFGDTVSIAPASHDRFVRSGPFQAAVPALEANVLGQALAMVRGWGRDEAARAPLLIALDKQLPVASGLGGGSADAAALVSLLTQNRALSADEKADCLALGADIPMCLEGKAALIEGIGEHVDPVTIPAAALVLVNPNQAVSTPQVFKRLAVKINPPLLPWASPPSFAELLAYLRQTRNDLTEPAKTLEPAIETCLQALSQAPFTRMSGSGATCFGLFETVREAEDLAARIKRTQPDWWVTAGTLR